LRVTLWGKAKGEAPFIQIFLTTNYTPSNYTGYRETNLNDTVSDRGHAQETKEEKVTRKQSEKVRVNMFQDIWEHGRNQFCMGMSIREGYLEEAGISVRF
jgi:hypothetical protein